jgi:transcriptional regulator with XRE-family HTH domain
MLNQKLRRARERRLWTIETAAEEVGVSWLTYSRWERGERKPRLSTLALLCKAFNMPAEELGFAEAIEQSLQDEARDVTRLLAPQPNQGVSIIVLTDQQVASLTALLGDNTMKFDASRRMMLQHLLGVTGLTLAISPQELLNPEHWERLSLSLVQPSNINAETLRHFGKLTETCWHLSNASEASTVEQILPTYLPKIEAIAKQPSKYQKAAANITSQGYILAAEVDKGNIAAMERYCDLAVEYSQVAEDHNLQVAALKQQATIALVARKTEKALQIYLQTLPFIRFASPLLRARIYMGLASAYARCGQVQDAQHYLGLAHDAFPAYPEDDPSYLYTVCSIPVLHLYDGLTYMDINKPQAAWDALEKVDGLHPKMSVPESSRIEIVNLQASAAIALEDMERGYTYLESGIMAARTQGYNLWASESFDVYQTMLIKWPLERQVKSMVDMFRQ